MRLGGSSLETRAVWAGFVFLTVPVKVSARTPVSQRRQERFDSVSEGAGIGKSQGGAVDGIRSLWLVDSFSRVGITDFSVVLHPLFMEPLASLAALGQLFRKHLGVVHEEQARWPWYQTLLGAPWT